MIERAEFMRAWEHLCGRFGRDPDPGQAAAYYGFLSEQMETESFLRAARTLWATAKWFPRPADFLLLEASGEWRCVLAAIEACHPPDWRWMDHVREMSPRGQAACDSLGGIHAMKIIHDKDVLRLKTAWDAAYEQATAETVLALPAPDRKRLASA